MDVHDGDRWMDVYVWRQVGNGHLRMATGRRWTSMDGDRLEMDVMDGDR